MIAIMLLVAFAAALIAIRRTGALSHPKRAR